MSPAERATVVLLQAKQSLGSVGLTDFAAAVRGAGADLRILRTGETPLVRDADVALDGIGDERIADPAEWRALLPDSTVAIVTNDEYLLDTARALCDERGLRTPIPGSWNNYRDKGVMRRALEEAGLPVTESLIVTAGIVTKAGNFGGFDPDEMVVVKPAAEANLRGIRIERYADVDLFALDNGLVERLLDGPQYHSEVLVADGAVTHLFSGRYVRSLLDLTRGGPSGSARADTSTEPLLAQLAVRTCRALGLDGTFTAHVEYLAGGTAPEDIVVSEVCARASGGEVPFQSRAITGVDLELLNLSIQAGLPWKMPVADAKASAAWLWRVREPITGAERIGHLPVRATFDWITLGGRARITGPTDSVLTALELLAISNEAP